MNFSAKYDNIWDQDIFLSFREKSSCPPLLQCALLTLQTERLHRGNPSVHTKPLYIMNITHRSDMIGSYLITPKNRSLCDSSLGKTQFQIKGGRLVRQSSFWDVLVPRWFFFVSVTNLSSLCDRWFFLNEKMHYITVLHIFTTKNQPKSPTLL